MTKRYNLPVVQISNCKIKEVLICEGSVIAAEEVSHSVLGTRSLIDEGLLFAIRLSIGTSTMSDQAWCWGKSSSPGIGKHCLIEKTILDENVSIGNHVTLINQKGRMNYDTADGLIMVRDGIIVVPRGTQFPIITFSSRLTPCHLGDCRSSSLLCVPEKNDGSICPQWANYGEKLKANWWQ